jgi:hypothetical protein
MDAALKLPRLTGQGGAQLAADAEYLAAVLNALAVAPSPGLVTLSLWAGQAADMWSDGASAAVAEGSADGRVMRAIGRARGLAWGQAGGGAPRPPPPPTSAAATAGGQQQQQHEEGPQAATAGPS